MKGRFFTLDGLRGVAALSVVYFHLASFRWVPEPPAAYLAVDLFFGLSGFVIAHAYDVRFRRGMTVCEFMKRRLVRLFPLYILTLIVFSIILYRDQIMSGTIVWHQMIATTFSNLLLFPTPFLTEQPAGLFPSDPPAWSLFLEFWIANLGYACLWRYLTGKTLLLIIAVSALGLVLCQNYYGTLNLGVRWHGFSEGVARVCFSFFLGISISRIVEAKAVRVKVAPWFLLSFLAVVLLAPIGREQLKFYELTCILVIFPLMIYFGSAVVETRPRLGALLGDISYAVYLLHYPIAQKLDAFARFRGYEPGVVSGASFLFGCVVIAYLVDRSFDVPMRRWLTGISQPLRSST